MQGVLKLSLKYYQEIAPNVAMDRAEVVKLDGIWETPAGKFFNYLTIKEGSALEPFVTEFKLYAPHIGLIWDEDLQLTRFGSVKK